MTRSIFSLCAVAALLPVLGSAQSQPLVAGQMIVPASNSVPLPDDGSVSHTNVRMILVPESLDPNSTLQPEGSPPFAGYLYETPASIGCVYKLVSNPIHGCNPNVVTQNPSGGVGAIAIVDAYDDPTAAADLAAFSKQFTLPLAPGQFQVVYATGTKPGLDSTGGWEIEEALDVQWAHAMAPSAIIYLVEAASNNDSDLLDAVIVASKLVASQGGGEVSMSWGGSEFKNEANFDSAFAYPGVVYYASSGDAPGTIWPSVSPNVIAAGGTSLSRDTSTGNFIIENVWQVTGSGLSRYQPRPAFQNSVSYVVGNRRGTPDQSFDANPNTGVWVLSTSKAGGYPAGWYIVGGTSVSAPSLAGITNATGALRSSSIAENTWAYKHPGKFTDTVYGNCGVYMSTFSTFGYDLCTGLGSPHK